MLDLLELEPDQDMEAQLEETTLELNNKVEENNKKILSKDEIISILKNINIEE